MALINFKANTDIINQHLLCYELTDAFKVELSYGVKMFSINVE